MRVELVQTAPSPFEPASAITDDEAGAMLRAAVTLFGLWKLTDKQAATPTVNETGSGKPDHGYAP